MIVKSGLKSVLALFLVAALLTGCTQAGFINGPLDGEEQAGTPQEEIVIWHTYSEEETKVFEGDIIPAFEREHPDIKVVSVRQPYSMELKSTIISRASSGKIPDIVRMDISWVPQLSSLGLLYPLSSLPDFSEVVRPLQGVTLTTNVYKGRYYGLPLDVNTKIAVYNRKRLSESGLNEPPRTLDQLLAAASSLQLPIGLSGLNTWSLMPYYLAMGGLLLNETNTHAEGYLNSDASKAAVHRLLAGIDQGMFKSDIIMGKGDRWGDILKGDLLMIDDGPWFYTTLSQVTDSGYDLEKTTVPAPFPGPSIIGGENLVILKETRHLMAAWTFLKWMTGTEVQERLFEVGIIPANTKAALPSRMKGSAFYRATLEGMKQPYLRPTIPQLDDVDTIFTSYMTRIMNRKLSVNEGLDRAAAEVERLLQANR